MHKILAYDRTNCTGCRYCEVACSFRHKGLCNRSDSLIRIVINERQFINAALFCRHCRKPICVDLCALDAISRNEQSGVVSIDSSKCIGCGLCLQCPLGGIHLDKDSGLAVHCDLCQGKPACVEFCPTGALRYVLSSEACWSRTVTSLSLIGLKEVTK